MKRPKPYRIPCAAIGCKRTVGEVSPNFWWLCPTHWALVPKSMRRVRSRIKRRNKKFETLTGEPGADPSPEATARIMARIFRQAGALPKHGRRVSP